MINQKEAKSNNDNKVPPECFQNNTQTKQYEENKREANNKRELCTHTVQQTSESGRVKLIKHTLVSLTNYYGCASYH